MNADVVIVGGGLIGLACAWRLAQAGSGVTVLDPRPGRAASWAAAGMIAPVSEASLDEPELLDLNLRSAAQWPAFAAELEEASGTAVGYQRSGTLIVARDEDDLALVDDLCRRQESLGLSVQRLRGRACRDLEPGLAPSVRGGLLAEADHSVDNRLVVEALLTALRRLSVEFVPDSVTRLVIQGDAAVGVETTQGAIHQAATVVVAAGTWSGRLAGLPAGALPIRPVRGELLHLAATPTQPLPVSHSVRAVVRGHSVYLVPRADGRLIVGATAEERGFDTTVRAGGVYELLRDAYEVVPATADLELRELVAGLRPGTPDNAPLIGFVPGITNLVVATGHYRNGVLLTPVTAEAVTHLVVKGSLPGGMRPFAADRFLPTAV